MNRTTGGSVQSMVMNECGARFAVSPSGASVETQAIGRGTTTEASRRQNAPVVMDSGEYSTRMTARQAVAPAAVTPGPR